MSKILLFYFILFFRQQAHKDIILSPPILVKVAVLFYPVDFMSRITRLSLFKFMGQIKIDPI
ncbi:MAG: hypothetical protein ACI8VC_001935 [Candidatus Endobugula sp.]|jgi:hypothetical protein